MKSLLCAVVMFGFSQAAVAGEDLRKNADSIKEAKAAAMYIVKEGAKMPKGASEQALKELKKICSNDLHKGCFFWAKSGEISFQPLDSKGEKDGKIYDLKGWLKRTFSK